MQNIKLSRLNVDPVLTIQHAAAIAGCCADTLKNQAKRGRLQLLRVSARRIGVRQSELHRYLQAAEIKFYAGR